MQKKNLKIITKLFSGIALFFGIIANGQNISIAMYGNNYTLDVTTLDTFFGDVIVNGTIRTTDFTNNVAITALPTTVAGFGTAQMVVIADYGYSTPLPQAQADALIAYVKQGGILITGLNSVYVGPANTFTREANEYFGEQLLTSSVNLTAIANSPSNPINGALIPYDAFAYHNVRGNLGILDYGARTIPTSSIGSSYTNVPSESAVFATVQPTSSGSCTSTKVVEFVAPAYPGGSAAKSVGINGFAYLSGLAGGPLSTNTYTGGGSTNIRTRNDGQSNRGLIAMIYDFLYNPSGMVSRRAWNSNSVNVNQNCTPGTSATECPSGSSSAPSLSSNNVTNTCPSVTVDLNNYATAAPTGTNLVWYTNDTHTGSPVANPTTVGASGVYYAYYQGASSGTSGCYSPASNALNVTITSPCTCDAGTTAPPTN